VNDPNANSQFLPAIAADQTTGTVAITWYDARNDPNNAKAQIYGTVTVDGGKNYVPDVKIGAQLSDTAAAVKVNQETAKASEDSTPTTLKDATKNWEVDQWAGKKVVITSGSAKDHVRTIKSNTKDTLTLFDSDPWTVAPKKDDTFALLNYD